MMPQKFISSPQISTHYCEAFAVINHSDIEAGDARVVEVVELASQACDLLVAQEPDALRGV